VSAMRIVVELRTSTYRVNFVQLRQFEDILYFSSCFIWGRRFDQRGARIVHDYGHTEQRGVRRLFLGFYGL
jgi:hypothetical protein